MSSVDLYRKIHPSYYLCMAAFVQKKKNKKKEKCDFLKIFFSLDFF